MNLLTVDCAFPSRYSTWRNNEIADLLRYGSDVLVYHVGSFAGTDYEFDWDFVNQQIDLSGYQVFVFDPRFMSKIREAGVVAIDAFGLVKEASYAVTNKGSFDIRNYDAVFCIFYSLYLQFNRSFNYPYERQIVHLYPGGGNTKHGRLELRDRTWIVATDPYTTKRLSGRKRVIDCWTGPMFGRNDPTVAGEARGHRALRVATASMGNAGAKGIGQFFEIADFFSGSEFEWVLIGRHECPQTVRRIEPMSYLELENYYRQEVDIFLNLESGQSFNGWPLGLEAAKHRSALFTTDANRFAAEYQARFPVLPCVAGDTKDFVNLLLLARDSNSWLSEAQAASFEFARHFASIENQQDRFLEVIDLVGSFAGSKTLPLDEIIEKKVAALSHSSSQALRKVVRILSRFRASLQRLFR